MPDINDRIKEMDAQLQPLRDAVPPSPFEGRTVNTGAEYVQEYARPALPEDNE